MATPVPAIHILKRQAKCLRDDLRRRDPAALSRARAVYHDLKGATDDQVAERGSLNRCLHILAVELSFRTWDEVLAAHQAQASEREPIVTSDDPDITWNPPLEPGVILDGITGERRQAPTDVINGMLVGLSYKDRDQRLTPSVLHPPFARYGSCVADPGREAWGALLKEVAAWASERQLGIQWAVPMAPEAGVPRQWSEVLYEFFICTRHETITTARFDRAAFEARFGDRILCLEVFPLETLLRQKQQTLPPVVTDKASSYEAVRGALGDRAVIEIEPIFGASREKAPQVLLHDRQGKPMVFSPFHTDSQEPRQGETTQEASIRSLEGELARRGITVSKPRNLGSSRERWFRRRVADEGWSSPRLAPMMNWVTDQGFGIEFAPGHDAASRMSFGVMSPAWNPRAPFDRAAFLARFSDLVEPCDPPGNPLDAYEQWLTSTLDKARASTASAAATPKPAAPDALADHIDAERKALAEEMRSTPLSDEHLRETREFLHDALGIEPTDAQIRAIIPPGSETHAIICAYGVEGDTATRDEIGDCFCEHLIGRRHPQFGDHLTEEQLAAFAAEITAAAAKAGIPIASDP